MEQECEAQYRRGVEDERRRVLGIIAHAMINLPRWNKRKPDFERGQVSGANMTLKAIRSEIQKGEGER